VILLLLILLLVLVVLDCSSHSAIAPLSFSCAVENEVHEDFC
jgi:hypothetical protein